MTAFSAARGLIVYSDVNTSSAANTPYWDNVLSFNGASGVYLGEGWVVTANHVGAPGSLIIAGTSYSVQSGTSQQIAGNDLRLFRLFNWQTIALANVNYSEGWSYNPISGTVIEGSGTMVAIGCGVGKGAVVDGGWMWNATSQKQWGLMSVATSPTDKCLTHYFDRTLGAGIAAGTLGDSGGGVFYQNSYGWHLGGVLTNVTDSGYSYYDRNPFAAGDQPGYTLSQRMAGVNAAEIYKTTRLWGISNTTVTSDGTGWVGDTGSALRAVMTGTASVSHAYVGLIDAAGTPTISDSAVGTLVVRAGANVALSGQVSIQTMTAETGAALSLQNADTTVETTAGSSIDCSLSGSHLTFSSYATKFANLRVEASTLAASGITANTLSVGAGAVFVHSRPMQIFVLGGGNGSWSYDSAIISQSVHIDTGAALSTSDFRVQGSSTTITTLGTLLIEGPGEVFLYSDKLFLDVNSTTAFNLGPHALGDLWGPESAFATAQILGNSILFLNGSLDILNSNLASQSASYVLFQAAYQNAFDLKFSNLSPEGILSTAYGSFLITSTWDGQYSRITASQFSSIPEPATWTLLLLGAAGAARAGRRRGGIFGRCAR